MRNERVNFAEATRPPVDLRQMDAPPIGKGTILRHMLILKRGPRDRWGVQSWEGVCVFCGTGLAASETKLTEWHTPLCGCNFGRMRQ